MSGFADPRNFRLHRGDGAGVRIRDAGDRVLYERRPDRGYDSRISQLPIVDARDRRRDAHRYSRDRRRDAHRYSRNRRRRSESLLSKLLWELPR